jgi:hypothetical protein
VLVVLPLQIQGEEQEHQKRMYNSLQGFFSKVKENCIGELHFVLVKKHFE